MPTIGTALGSNVLKAMPTAENIAGEINHILDDPEYRGMMRQDLANVREILGHREGSVELAQLAARILKGQSL